MFRCLLGGAQTEGTKLKRVQVFNSASQICKQIRPVTQLTVRFFCLPRLQQPLTLVTLAASQKRSPLTRRRQ